MNIFYHDHTIILRAFNEYEVEYLLIGGYAVIYHGYPRTTGDMDIWLKPDNENKSKIIQAFVSLGYDEQSIQHLHTYDFTEAVIFHLGIEPEKVEFLTKVSLLNFDEAYARRQNFEMEENFIIPFLTIQDLILSKINTGRAKDAADVEELQKIQRFKEKK
jgi:hypothetical protein